MTDLQLPLTKYSNNRNIDISKDNKYINLGDYLYQCDTFETVKKTYSIFR